MIAELLRLLDRAGQHLRFREESRTLFTGFVCATVTKAERRRFLAQFASFARVDSVVDFHVYIRVPVAKLAARFLLSKAAFEFSVVVFSTDHHTRVYPGR